MNDVRNEYMTTVEMLDRIARLVSDRLLEKNAEVNGLVARLEELKKDPNHKRNEELDLILAIKATMAAGDAYNEVAKVFVEYVESEEGNDGREDHS